MKTWTLEKRGVKPGDIVLISYTDKSKTGTWKLGRVESVETDEDGLVRTCVVEYRLVRADIPHSEMKIYLKGLKHKKIRVPVQRLCLILPVEEQNGCSINTSKEKIVHYKTDTTEIVEKSIDISDYDENEVNLNDPKQIVARNLLIEKFRYSKLKKQKIQKTKRTIKFLNQVLSSFLEVWKECQEMKIY